MTYEQYMTAMCEEWGNWFNGQGFGIEPMDAEEALLVLTLTMYQRHYITSFIKRWEWMDGEWDNGTTFAR